MANTPTAESDSILGVVYTLVSVETVFEIDVSPDAVIIHDFRRDAVLRDCTSPLTPEAWEAAVSVIDGGFGALAPSYLSGGTDLFEIVEVSRSDGTTQRVVFVLNSALDLPTYLTSQLVPLFTELVDAAESCPTRSQDWRCGIYIGTFTPNCDSIWPLPTSALPN